MTLDLDQAIGRAERLQIAEAQRPGAEWQNAATRGAQARALLDHPLVKAFWTAERERVTQALENQVLSPGELSDYYHQLRAAVRLREHLQQLINDGAEAERKIAQAEARRHAQGGSVV